MHMETMQQPYLLSCQVCSHILQNLKLLGVHAHSNLWHSHPHLRMLHFTQTGTHSVTFVCENNLRG